MPCPSQSSRFNHPDYIRQTVQTMKFLIVEPSPLHILIPLGPNIRLSQQADKLMILELDFAGVQHEHAENKEL